MAGKAVDRKSVFKTTVLNRSRTAFQKQAFETDGLQGSNILPKDEESRRWSEAVFEEGNNIGLIKVSKGKDAEQHLGVDVTSSRFEHRRLL